MDLSQIDVYDPAIWEKGVPHEQFALLRREAPVFFHAEPDGPGFWAITRHADIFRISREPKSFSSARGGTNLFDWDEGALKVMEWIMINMDPPVHVKHRRLVQKGFTPRRVAMLGPRIHEQAKEIVDRIAEKGECEFVTAVAAELPLMVLAELMGIPIEDRHYVFELSNRLIVPLHRPRAATGADIERAQTELIADFFRVIVFFPADCMAAPAHDEVWFHGQLQNPRVAKNVENGVADIRRCLQVEPAAFVKFVVRINDIAKHREQQFPDTANHLAVDEGRRRRAFQGHFETAVLLLQSDFEVPVFLQHRAGIVHVGAGVQYGQDGAPQQRMQPAFTMVSKLLRFDL